MTTLRDTARDLFDLVDHNAREAGREPVPQATVDALVEAGLHAVMTPSAVGGLETSVVEAIDVFAEISRADGSAGWCLMANAATIAFFGAWSPDDFATTLFADDVPLAAGQFAPNGVATPEGEGYRITGDYHFGSGVRHSAWVGAGVVTESTDGTDALRAGPLQTCFRDIHAGSQHFFAGDLASIELGRSLLAEPTRGSGWRSDRAGA